jgi:hypothetical protein
LITTSSFAEVTAGNQNNVFAYQMTNGGQHPVLASELSDMYELVARCLPDETFNHHLVFVCPAGKANTDQFTSQTIDSKTDSCSTIRDEPVDCRDGILTS